MPLPPPTAVAVVAEYLYLSSSLNLCEVLGGLKFKLIELYLETPPQSVYAISYCCKYFNLQLVFNNLFFNYLLIL